MPESYDDATLSRPLEGAAEATAAEGPDSPAVGRDEWVARHGERRTRRAGVVGRLEARLELVPWWAWLTLIVAVGCLLPVAYDSGYVRRVAFDIVIYMLLALGLNVVVGWGGLLDLGYAAFFGVGAYTYALLASDKFDVHLPTIVLIPIVIAVGAGVGYLVGLPSWRLSGDYLAIVTLFFVQIFNTVTTNGDDLFGHDVTGGPNGILNVDPLGFFGWDLPAQKEGLFNVAYLYVALAFFAVVFVALRFINESRTGRAWRSLREDPLAAEVMGMPVNWLKLMAFAFGSATAALTGAVATSLYASVFPQTFEFALLITIYTMVVLGGAGSMFGVVLGAIMVGALLEVLREPGDSRYVFYVVLLLGLVAAYRLTWKLAVAVGGTVAFGFALHAIAEQRFDSLVSGTTNDGGRLAGPVSDWVLLPSDLGNWAPISYITLVVLALCLTLVSGWRRVALLVPTLYLAIFVWENVMTEKPEPTRFIVLGVILIATMIARPEGLLGEKRVEIV